MLYWDISFSSIDFSSPNFFESMALPLNSLISSKSIFFSELSSLSIKIPVKSKKFPFLLVIDKVNLDESIIFLIFFIAAFFLSNFSSNKSIIWLELEE